MPAAKKVSTEVVSEGRPVRARNTRVEQKFDELDSSSEEDEVAVVKPRAKATAKSTSKATAAKNAKKRARDEEEESDFEEKEETPKKKAKKASGAVVVVATEEPKPKKAAAKKSTAKKDDEDDGSGDDEPQLEIVPTDFATPVLAPGELKIVSWNVAGYRAVVKKGFEEYLKSESPDIIALQESKVPSSRLGKEFPGYYSYFFGCQAKSGLHGTALFSKVQPIKVDFLEDFDQEGRVIVAEFESFFLLNTYVPNSGQKLERLNFRIDWDQKLQAMFLKLQQTKPVIWCGDLNVAKDALDLANPTTNVRTNNSLSPHF